MSLCLSLSTHHAKFCMKSLVQYTLVPFFVLSWRISRSDPAGFSRYLDGKTSNTLLFLGLLWEPHFSQEAAEARSGLVQLRFHDALYAGSGPATPSLNCKASGLARANRHTAEMGFRERSAAPPQRRQPGWAPKGCR